MQNRTSLTCVLNISKILNVLNAFLSSKQNATNGSQDDIETANEETAMESDVTERAIGIAYSLVNTCLSQLCECYCINP